MGGCKWQSGGNANDREDKRVLPIVVSTHHTPLCIPSHLIRTPLGEVDGLLVGLDGDGRSLLLGKAATDGTSLLVAEVEGEVLRLLVELAEVLALLLVDDGKNTGDRLADSVAATLVLAL